MDSDDHNSFEDWEEKSPRIKRKEKGERLANLLGSEVYQHLFLDKERVELVNDYSNLTGYSNEIIDKYFSRIQKRFLKGQIGKRTYDKLYDLITNPNSDEKDELIEKLMREEFKGLRKLDDIRIYDEADPTWEIDKLGLNYFEEVQRGYGTSVDNRSEEQIGIINDIIKRSLPRINSIVKEFLEKGYIFTPYSKIIEVDEDEEEIIKSKGAFLKTDKVSLGDEVELEHDLVNYISQKLIESMHNYFPEQNSMSSFIDFMSKANIIRYVDNKVPFVRIPINSAGRIRKEISESNTRNEAIGGIETILSDGMPHERYSSDLIHDSIRGEIGSLNDLDPNIPDESLGQNLDPLVRSIDASRFLAIIDNLVNQYKGSIDSKAQAKLERNKRIIRDCIEGHEDGSKMNLAEVGNKYGMTRENVRKIFGKFLRKIRGESKNTRMFMELADFLSE